MNFHISNLSPLRPQFSSSSLGGPRRHQRDFHDSGRFVPVKIEVEHADPDDVEGDLYPGGKARSNGAHSRLDEVDDTDTDTDTPSDTSAEDDVTQDSRDVLVQRLTDLAERLGGARGVGAAGVEALHRHVDEMERELRRSSSRTRDGDRSASRRSSRRRRSSAALPRPRSLQLPSSSTLSSPGGGGDSFRGRESLGVMAAPMSPSWFMSQFQRRPSVHAREPEPVEETEAGAEDADGPDGREELASRQHSNSDSLVPQQQRQSREPADQSVVDETSSEHHAQPTSISSEVVEDVVKEAEKLCAEMATVIESLQTRREESDHLHTVLVQREAVATKRSHERALAAAELEDVVADNEAELRHLRLELRAIEVQCMGYVPRGADPELKRSIRNWKDDWQELRDRWASRRGSSFVAGEDGSSTTTTVSTLASPTSR